MGINIKNRFSGIKTFIGVFPSFIKIHPLQMHTCTIHILVGYGNVYTSVPKYTTLPKTRMSLSDYHVRKKRVGN